MSGDRLGGDDLVLAQHSLSGPRWRRWPAACRRALSRHRRRDRWRPRSRNHILHLIGNHPAIAALPKRPALRIRAKPPSITRAQAGAVLSCRRYYIEAQQNSCHTAAQSVTFDVTTS